MNVNFWDKETILYINGIPCCKINETILDRGQLVGKLVTLKVPLDSHARSVLFYHFGLSYDCTVFSGRIRFRPGLRNTANENWEKVADKNGWLYEDTIKYASIDINYSRSTESPAMKYLVSYPTDLVIEYLKERGMAICPMRLQD